MVFLENLPKYCLLLGNNNNYSENIYKLKDCVLTTKLILYVCMYVKKT